MLKSTVATTVLAGLAAGAANAQWVNYVNETSTRLVASSSLIFMDNLEKDFHWADLDQDGDIDLICMRKFPGSVQGGFRNILFMNENGVLVDRTVEYGSAADVGGSQGMMDPTNDRDVKAIDVDNDGWLDLVTATTMSDNLNTMLGQPRVYKNRGNDGGGNWLGFRFEDSRIPALFARNGNAGNPRFCDAAIADYNGDGYVDIFYTDYDTPETSGQTLCLDLNNDGDTNDAGECQFSPAENSSIDYDNKLLLNFGAANPGHFYDATTAMLTSAQINSAFGNSAFAGDMNGDGLADIVRVNTLTGGQDVAIYTKRPAANGFDGPKQAVAGAPYFVEKADLNGDGRLDIVVVDDGKDKYLINTGNDANGAANFTSYTIADSLSEFGNTAQVGDLDKDGRIDVIITDVDADLGPFCPSTGRRTHIYRNVYSGSPSGILAEGTPPLPTGSLAAWTDVAIFDINGDGWLDLVVGRCAGIEVWMNHPPISLTFSYPNGRPSTTAPGETTSFAVNTAILGGGTVVPGTAKIHWSVDNGAFNEATMANTGANTWLASLPPFSCGDSVRYYVSAQLSNLGVVKDPATAPSAAFSIGVESSAATVFVADIEGDVSGWSVVNEGALTTGAWQAVVPIGATNGTQGASAPSSDASVVGNKAFVTQNGVNGGSATSADVDGGTTRLVSPVFDLTGASGATLSYARWYFCSDAISNNAAEIDPLLVEVSLDNGGSWTRVEDVRIVPSPNAWVFVNIDLGFYFASFTNQMRLRFSLSDSPENSITEGGIDEVRVTASYCADACLGDLDGDGAVGGSDLGQLLGGWGSAGTGDLDNDGTVGGSDLGMLLGAWGACP